MNRYTDYVDPNNKNNENTRTNNYKTDDINWWQWPQTPTPNELTRPNLEELLSLPPN